MGVVIYVMTLDNACLGWSSSDSFSSPNLVQTPHRDQQSPRECGEAWWWQNVQGDFLGLGVGMTSPGGHPLTDVTWVEYREKSKAAFPALCMENVDWDQL